MWVGEVAGDETHRRLRLIEKGEVAVEGGLERVVDRERCAETAERDQEGDGDPCKKRGARVHVRSSGS